jgi:hypothetical protein
LNVWLEVVISKLPANTSSDGLEGSYKKSLWVMLCLLKGTKTKEGILNCVDFFLIFLRVCFLSDSEF